MHPSMIIILLAGLGVSFFLSGMEAGVFALSRFRIKRLIREGNAQARLLYDYLEKPEDFLWTICIGNTIANFTVTALAVMAVHDWLGHYHRWFWLLFLPGGLLFYATCDLLPKMLFRTYPNRLCLLFLRPFRVVRSVLRPVIWLMTRLSAVLLLWSGRQAFSGRLFGTRDELRQLMQESARQMTSEERSMINRVLDLQTLTVGRLMVPLARVVSVQTHTPAREALELSRQHNITRLPVWEEKGGERRVAGLLNVRSLIYAPSVDPETPARQFLKPAIFLDEDRRLEDALGQLQRSGQRLAVVLDAQHKEVGVISLQDILQVVFGKFHF